MGVRPFSVSPLATYATGLNFSHISGQSLAEGNVGGATLTTAQEYDNVKFAKGADTPAAYEAAVAVGSNTETPMYGMIGHAKELLTGAGAATGKQLLTCNNGYGSYSILVLQKGQSPFTRAISQVTAGKAIATSEGRAFKFVATAWAQGEADNAMSQSDYRTVLRKLANDYDDMGRAASGQTDSPIFITYQCTTNASPTVPLAQLEASQLDRLIFVACPKYPFEFSPDGLHFTATSAKLLGGYFGLVIHRVVHERGTWSPLQPISHTRNGAAVDLAFSPVGQLTIDTTQVPEQPNYGFQAFDSSGVEVTINSVAIVGSNTVRITTASAIPGGTIKYAQGSQPEPVHCLGGAGNLRDSQGDTMTYVGRSMHNWCVLFSMVVAA